MLHEEQGQICLRDVRMAPDVAHSLKQLMATAALSLNEEQVEDYFFQLKVGPLVVCGLGCGAQARPGSWDQGTLRLRLISKGS